MVYSEDEQIVLDYFFTNLDSEVFAVKNFHPEVWALMQARYSRSREGLRESFLKLITEDPDNFEKLLDEIRATDGGINSKYATEKAIQFMEKWVLGYGHSSVSEGAVIGIGIEGLSILATKIIEDCRLSSFIEKSTRYVSYDQDSFYLDDDLMNSEFADEIKQLMRLLFLVYTNLHLPVLEYIKSVAPKDDDTNDAAWLRACAARRFDAIRTLLPASTKTSLGMTINARELSHMISKLLSHPLKEANKLGEQIKKEASELLPSLLRFADPVDYFIQTQKDMSALAKDYVFDNVREDDVVLVNATQNPDDLIIASILYRYKNQSFNVILDVVSQMSDDEKQQIFDTYLSNMGPHDHPMRELEHVNFTFDIVMDYGAYRDLQRHRISTQTAQLLTCDLGYDVPNDIINAGVESQYRFALDKAKELYLKISDKYPQQAQYLLPMAFKKRFMITMNLREIHHLVKIRTTPLAHESYRMIAYKIYEIMKEKYPLLSKYIVCNFKQENLGRLKSEEQTEKLFIIGPL